MKLLLLILSFLALSAFCFKTEKSFILLEATQQSWIGGIQGSGRGVNYQFKIVIQTQKRISLDTIWLNDSKYKLEISKGRIRNYQLPLKNNDTLTLMMREFFPDESTTKFINRENEKLLKVEKIKAPIKFDGRALIRFYLGEKKKYFTVKEIFKKEDLMYQ